MHQPESKQALKSLLSCSIEYYRQQEKALQSLKNGLNNSLKSRTCEQIESLLRLQSATMPVDTQIIELLTNEQTDIDLTARGLNEQRLQVMQRVYRLNRELLPHAEGVKTLLQSELRNIASGRGAVKGYMHSFHNDQTYFSNSY